jgi:membrane protease YdiL (CAAX protease family)
MKIARGFIVIFLLWFLAAIILNIVALAFGVYETWMLYTLIGFFVILIILFLRKRLKSKDKKKKGKPRGIIKFFLILAILTILGYVAYNYIPSVNSSNYFYDIGSQLDAKSPYLSPQSHTSVVFNQSNVYRKISITFYKLLGPIKRINQPE